MPPRMQGDTGMRCPPAFASACAAGKLPMPALHGALLCESAPTPPLPAPNLAPAVPALPPCSELAENPDSSSPAVWTRLASCHRALDDTDAALHVRATGPACHAAPAGRTAAACLPSDTVLHRWPPGRTRRARCICLPLPSMPASMPVQKRCPPLCLPVCLPACPLSAHPTSHPFACPPACPPAPRLPTRLGPGLPACLPAYIPSADPSGPPVCPPACLQVYQTVVQQLGPDHPGYIDAVVALAELHRELGQQDEADK